MSEETAKSHKQSVAALFGLVAPDYDTVIPYFHTFGERIVAWIAARPGERVLDVCAGTGATLIPVARLGADVTGIDLAAPMVEALRSRIAAERLDTARAEVMDAEHLDFAEASFDTLVCAFGIMFLPHLDEALRGFHRVVRPGGRVVVAVWSESIPDRAFISETAVRHGGGVDPLTSETTLPWSSDEGMNELLLGAGFSAPEIRSEDAHFVFDDFEMWWRWQMSIGMRAAIVSVPQANAAAFRSDLREQWSRMADEGHFTLRQRARLARATR